MYVSVYVYVYLSVCLCVSICMSMYACRRIVGMYAPTSIGVHAQYAYVSQFVVLSASAVAAVVQHSRDTAELAHDGETSWLERVLTEKLNGSRLFNR